MIELITGVPGAGKTLYAIKRLMEYKKDNRLIFSNIDGLKVDGVQPLKKDWRDTPEGSVIIMDEAQRIWPSSGKTGISEKEDIRALDTHRHTGHDFILITQAPTLIDVTVRKFVGRHIHIYRGGGLNLVSLRIKDEVMNVSDKRELRSATKETWKHEKKYYDLYKSASIHTVKKRIPKKIFIGIFVIILIFTGVAYGVSQLSFFNADDDTPPVASQTTTPQNTVPIYNQKPQPQNPLTVNHRGYSITEYQSFPLTDMITIVGSYYSYTRQIYVLEIGRPPNAYQLLSTAFEEYGYLLEPISPCRLIMAKRSHIIDIGCPLHERNIPPPPAPSAGSEAAGGTLSERPAAAATLNPFS